MSSDLTVNINCNQAGRASGKGDHGDDLFFGMLQAPAKMKCIGIPL